MSKSVVEHFADLFKGSEGTYGQWNPKNGKMHTEKSSITIGEFTKHLNGEYGAGVVPINEDGNCFWGAIDIDNHSGENSAVNIDIVAKAVFNKGLPLIPCRSKSGGVHCYLFTSEPVPANIMKRVLTMWAADIGHAGAEIFPKQTELRDNLTGNWINLPYFNAMNTDRYSVEVEEGRVTKLTLKEFIGHATRSKLSQDMIKSFILAGHEQAPPCIQELMINGVPKGVRNEVVYGLTIYLKKKLPPSMYKQEVINFNQTIFERPLTLSEINKSITSASRSDYRYKCMESPFRDYCDSATCVNRKYGIDKSDAFETAKGVPEFTKLRVMSTEPPLWEITVNDKPVITTTKRLRDFRDLAEDIMEKLFIVVPILSNKDWMAKLSELMENLEMIEAPDNASTTGVIRERLLEFVDRADFNSNGKDPNDKDLILRGLPVMQEVHDQPGKRHILFKGTDFISYLKRTRSEELKGTALWMAIQKMGVTNKRTRIKGKVTSVWALPVDGKGRTKLDYEYEEDVVFINVKGSHVRLMTKVNF